MFKVNKDILDNYFIPPITDIILDYQISPNVEKWARNNKCLLNSHFESTDLDSVMNETTEMLVKMVDDSNMFDYIHLHILKLNALHAELHLLYLIDAYQQPSIRNFYYLSFQLQYKMFERWWDN